MDAEQTSREYSVEHQLQQLDESIALTRVGGDPELLCEVIGLFLDDYPHSLEKIREAVTTGDPSGVEQHAHSLKGSVSIFGAQESIDAAFALEKQGRSGDLTAASSGLERLEPVHAVRPGQQLRGHRDDPDVRRVFRNGGARSAGVSTRTPGA